MQKNFAYESIVIPGRKIFGVMSCKKSIAHFKYYQLKPSFPMVFIHLTIASKSYAYKLLMNPIADRRTKTLKSLSKELWSFWVQ